MVGSELPSPIWCGGQRWYNIGVSQPCIPLLPTDSIDSVVHAQILDQHVFGVQVHHVDRTVGLIEIETIHEPERIVLDCATRLRGMR